MKLVSRAVAAGERGVVTTGRLRVRWVRRHDGSLLAGLLKRPIWNPGRSALDALVEERTRLTDARGPQTLWEGYGQGTAATRLPSVVRAPAAFGRAYRELVSARQPSLVVEVGTAFGVSGMYWLAGLEGNGNGHLLTFEINPAWAEVARENLAAVGTKFTLVEGKFEDNLGMLEAQHPPIGLAFLDGVHTSEWVIPQFEAVVARSAPGTLVVFDDIDFSDDMGDCWARLSRDARVRASLTLGARVGVVELAAAANP